MADRRSDPGRSTDAADGPVAAPGDVVLVGAGARANAWLAPLRGARRLRAVAAVTRDAGRPLAGLPHCGSLAEAMRALPAGVVRRRPAAACGARERAAAGRAGPRRRRRSAAARRAGRYRAPARLAEVRVAHGWVTLPGLRAIACGHAAIRCGPTHHRAGGSARRCRRRSARGARARGGPARRHAPAGCTGGGAFA